MSDEIATEPEWAKTIRNLDRAAFNKLVVSCHQSSCAHGWWDAPNHQPMVGYVDSMTPTKIALIHSEVSEALEGFRKSLDDKHLPHRSNLEVELADVIIRVMDLAGAHDLDLAGAIVEKMQVNWDRADHKSEAREAAGGKKF